MMYMNCLIKFMTIWEAGCVNSKIKDQLIQNDGMVFLRSCEQMSTYLRKGVSDRAKWYQSTLMKQ